VHLGTHHTAPEALRAEQGGPSGTGTDVSRGAAALLWGRQASAPCGPAQQEHVGSGGPAYPGNPCRAATPCLQRHSRGGHQLPLTHGTRAGGRFRPRPATPDGPRGMTAPPGGTAPREHPRQRRTTPNSDTTRTTPAQRVGTGVQHALPRHPGPPGGMPHATSPGRKARLPGSRCTRRPRPLASPPARHRHGGGEQGCSTRSRDAPPPPVVSRPRPQHGMRGEECRTRSRDHPAPPSAPPAGAWNIRHPGAAPRELPPLTMAPVPGGLPSGP
jgi:hypothetical protein